VPAVDTSTQARLALLDPLVGHGRRPPSPVKGKAGQGFPDTA
jgi:hypothetical protein